MSLEIEISVKVDDTTYAVSRLLATGGYGNNTAQGIQELDKAIEKIRAAMRGNLPPTNKQGVG